MTPDILIFEINLLETNPPVWRIIEISQKATLHDLHAVIQVAMGWKNGHLYSYSHSEKGHKIEYVLPEYDESGEFIKARNPKDFKLKEIFKEVGDFLYYTYDWGDDWRHRVQLRGKKYQPSKVGYPACVAGARCCPPEDVGGVHGYVELLKYIETKNKKELKVYEVWMGYRFDPDEFLAERYSPVFAAQVKQAVKGFSLWRDE